MCSLLLITIQRSSFYILQMFISSNVLRKCRFSELLRALNQNVSGRLNEVLRHSKAQHCFFPWAPVVAAAASSGDCSVSFWSPWGGWHHRPGHRAWAPRKKGLMSQLLRFRWFGPQLTDGSFPAVRGGASSPLYFMDLVFRGLIIDSFLNEMLITKELFNQRGKHVGNKGFAVIELFRGNVLSIHDGSRYKLLNNICNKRIKPFSYKWIASTPWTPPPAPLRYTLLCMHEKLFAKQDIHFPGEHPRVETFTRHW